MPVEAPALIGNPNQGHFVARTGENSPLLSFGLSGLYAYGMDANFIYSLSETLNSATKMEDEAPWRLVIHTTVGGAFAAGFDDMSEDLIAVSETGQTIFDCSDGSRLYRNRESSGYDKTRLEAVRLDVSDPRPVKMAGDHGGGMCKTTSDGWSVDVLQIKWPTAFSILHKPGASIFFLAPQWAEYGKDASFELVMKSEGLPVAFGFSWSGKSLVWLDRSDLFIWHRDM